MEFVLTVIIGLIFSFILRLLLGNSSDTQPHDNDHDWDDCTDSDGGDGGDD